MVSSQSQPKGIGDGIGIYSSMPLFMVKGASMPGPTKQKYKQLPALKKLNHAALHNLITVTHTPKKRAGTVLDQGINKLRPINVKQERESLYDDVMN